jgi:hypothetical protein
VSRAYRESVRTRTVLGTGVVVVMWKWICIVGDSWGGRSLRHTAWPRRLLIGTGFESMCLTHWAFVLAALNFRITELYCYYEYNIVRVIT